MKKIICTGLACMMAFSIAGCGNKTTSSPMDSGEDVEEIRDLKEARYKVIEDSDFDFEETPSNDFLGKEGYVVKVDGQYGFVNPEGTFVMDPEYDNVQFYFGRDESGNIKYEDCMYFWKDGSFPGDSLAYVLGKSDQSEGGLQGYGGAVPPIFINDNNEVVQCDYPLDYGNVSPFEWHEGQNGMLVPKLSNPTQAMSAQSDSDTQWYIVFENGKNFGPYNGSENATFLLHRQEGYELVELGPTVYGLFYEKTEDGYKVWDKDGEKCYEEVVDFATPISFNAMKIEKNGKMGVIDSNMNLVLYGDFEDVTLPIYGHAFVKMDGSWKFIEIQ